MTIFYFCIDIRAKTNLLQGCEKYCPTGRKPSPNREYTAVSMHVHVSIPCTERTLGPCEASFGQIPLLKRPRSQNRQIESLLVRKKAFHT